MTEETIQAARRAWANDPEAAAQALLGCSAEELFITALRGCNQHKHKPGCPDANGGGEDAKKVSESLLNGVWECFDSLTYDSENWDKFQPMDIKNALRELLKKEKNAPDPNNEEAMFKFAKANLGTVYEALTGGGRSPAGKPAGTSAVKSVREAQEPQERVSNRKPRILDQRYFPEPKGAMTRKISFSMRDEIRKKTSYYSAISKKNGLWEISEAEGPADDRLKDEPKLPENDAWVKLTKNQKSPKFQEYMERLWNAHGKSAPYFRHLN